MRSPFSGFVNRRSAGGPRPPRPVTPQTCSLFPSAFDQRLRAQPSLPTSRRRPGTRTEVPTLRRGRGSTCFPRQACQHGFLPIENPAAHGEASWSPPGGNTPRSEPKEEPDSLCLRTPPWGDRRSVDGTSPPQAPPAARGQERLRQAPPRGLVLSVSRHSAPPPGKGNKVILSGGAVARRTDGLSCKLRLTRLHRSCSPRRPVYLGALAALQMGRHQRSRPQLQSSPESQAPGRQGAGSQHAVWGAGAGGTLAIHAGRPGAL